MIITRTPFRISFFGGGTDIPQWFGEHGGQVLSTTIDKYCYVTARPLPPFFDHRLRLAYSRIETVSRTDEIQHPLLRAVLDGYEANDLEIHYDADLPGQSGLGTSSSFAVGLVAALEGLRGRMLSRKELADAAIHYEREVLEEPGGYQDQVAAAYGGFNRIEFRRDGTYSANPLPLSRERRQALLDSLMLCYIPLKRFSGDVSLANNYSKDYSERLRFLNDSVDEGVGILQGGGLEEFGRLLHETWLHKRSFDGVTRDEVDEVYEAGRRAGALGGKILGAGGGGFMLFFVPPERRQAVAEALSDLLIVPFGLENEGGGRIIYYHND